MRCISLVAFTILTLVVTPRLRAAPFQNLDFEQATIKPALPGYVPSDAAGYTPLDSAAALPDWTVTVDTTVCNAVFGEANILDLSSVCLVHLGNLYNPLTPPIQGNYEVQLYSVPFVPDPPYFETASISQTGDIPSTSKSVQFLIRNPPGASNIPSIPDVYLNGISIPVVTLSTSNGVITMAGDVSTFAGTTATLTLEAQGQSAHPFAEDIFELDAITFSSSPAPEPSSLALLAIGGLISVRWRRP